MTEISVGMQRVIEKLDEEVGLLEMSLANAADRIEELMAENTSTERENERLESRMVELKGENAELRRQIARLETRGMEALRVERGASDESYSWKGGSQ